MTAQGYGAQRILNPLALDQADVDGINDLLRRRGDRRSPLTKAGLEQFMLNGAIAVVPRGSEIAAIGAIYYQHSLSGLRARIESIHIDESDMEANFRIYGVLLDSLLDQADSMGIRQVEMMVQVIEGPAAELYQELGFDTVSEEKLISRPQNGGPVRWSNADNDQ